MKTQTIWVVSFAPAYDHGGVGGFEWRRTQGEAAAVLADLLATDASCSDFRLLRLDLPATMSEIEIFEFLAGPGDDVIVPPDPRDDLADALDAFDADRELEEARAEAEARENAAEARYDAKKEG